MSFHESRKTRICHVSHYWWSGLDIFVANTSLQTGIWTQTSVTAQFLPVLMTNQFKEVECTEWCRQQISFFEKEASKLCSCRSSDYLLRKRCQDAMGSANPELSSWSGSNEFIVYLMIAVLSKEGFIISTDFGIRYQLVQSSRDLKLAGSKNLQIFQLIHLLQFLFVAIDSDQVFIEQHCHCIWLLTFPNSLN